MNNDIFNTISSLDDNTKLELSNYLEIVFESIINNNNELLNSYSINNQFISQNREDIYNICVNIINNLTIDKDIYGSDYYANYLLDNLKYRYESFYFGSPFFLAASYGYLLDENVIESLEKLEGYLNEKTNNLLSEYFEKISSNISFDKFIYRLLNDDMLLEKFNSNETIKNNFYTSLMVNIKNNKLDYLNIDLDNNSINKIIDNSYLSLFFVFVSDIVFKTISIENIKKILSNKYDNNINNSSNIFNLLSTEKQKYIINTMDLKEFIDYSKEKRINIPYELLDRNLTKDELDYAIEFDKTYGIENNKYVTSNIEYTDKLINSGYYNIFKKMNHTNLPIDLDKMKNYLNNHAENYRAIFFDFFTSGVYKEIVKPNTKEYQFCKFIDLLKQKQYSIEIIDKLFENIKDINSIGNYFDENGIKNNILIDLLFPLDNINYAILRDTGCLDNLKGTNFIKFIDSQIQNNKWYTELNNLISKDNYITFFNNIEGELYDQEKIKNIFIFFNRFNDYIDYTIFNNLNSIYKYVDEYNVNEETINNFDKYIKACKPTNEHYEKLYKSFYNNYDINSSLRYSLSLKYYNAYDLLNLVEKNKERINRYYSLNDELFNTIDMRLFEDKYNVISDCLIQQLFLYPNLQDKLISLSDDNNTFNVLIILLEYIDKYDKKIDKNSLIYNVLYNIENYKEILNNNNNNLDEVQIKNLIYILQGKYNYFNVKNIDDLNNFEEIKDRKYEEWYNTNDIQLLQQIIFYKTYGLSMDNVRFIIDRYCSKLDKLENSNFDERLYNILKSINKIDKCNDIDKLKTLARTTSKCIVDFDISCLLDSLLREEFARKYSDKLYKPKEEHNIKNNPIINNNEVLDRLNKIESNIYMIDGDFNLQVHALGAYRSYITPDNFKDAWNIPKISNHGICTSYIGNNQIAVARAYHPILGFDSYSGDEMLLCGPHDLGSKNVDFNSTMEKPGYFMTPDELINHTRHTHNEIVIERKKIIDGKIYKRQPKYVVLVVDDINNLYNFKKEDELTEEEKNNAYKKNRSNIYEESIKAAHDFNIPIVIVDRLKYAKEERIKCDNLLNMFKEDNNPIYINKLLESILNNMIGCYNYYNEDLEYCNLFSNEVLTNYLYSLGDIIETLDNDKKLNMYQSLLDSLKIENSKFDLIGFTFIDMDLNDYIYIVQEKIFYLNNTYSSSKTL